MVGNAYGPHPRRAKIVPSRISSGCHVAGAEENCHSEYLQGAGMYIDDAAPYTDRKLTECGYGRIFTTTYP
jgi:hypothetical protein